MGPTKTTEKYRNTPKGRIAPNGYRLCDPLPEGQVLIDNEKKQWTIGKPIGLGGFGEIYLCYEKSDSSMKEYVMKLDNNTGPLFVEVNFVLRACQKTSISNFMQTRGLSFLGIPRFITYGTHQSKNSYRFLIMDRLGEELQKVLETRRLSIRVTCRIACRIIDVLEYIHDQGYIHADIKAQNILRTYYGTKNGKKKSSKRSIDDTKCDSDDIDEDDKYYLIDYGLAERYTLQGEHKPYEFDKRKANNGTAEFRSRDAHIGVISRRSDIESLGFNLILWFYGRHPWGNLLKNPDQVNEKKCWAMKNIDEFLKESFGDKPLDTNGAESSDSKTTSKKPKASNTSSKRNIPISCKTPKGLNKFFEEINRLAHDERPDYNKLKNILMEIARLNNGLLTTPSSGVKKKGRLSQEVEDEVDSTPASRSKRRQVNGGNKKPVVKPEIVTTDDETELDDSISLVQKRTRANGIAKTNGSRAMSAKKKLTAASAKKPTSEATTTPRTLRNLKNRIQIEEEDSDDLTKDIISYSKSKKMKPPRAPRLSTPLMMMTPPDGGDSPLYGPFEPEDSFNESFASRNGRDNSLTILSNESEDEEDAQDHQLRSCRIYINNKRYCPRQSSKENIINNNYRTPLRPPPSTTESSEEDLKSTASSSRAKNVSAKKTSSSSSKVTTAKRNGIVKNGKAKLNGHVSSSSSSTVKSAASRRTQKTNHSTSSTSHQLNTTPVSTIPVVETAAMQRIRMLIEKKKQNSSTPAKK